MKQIFAVVIIALSAFLCQAASAVTYQGRLPAGAQLNPGDSVLQGDYYLTLQATDGNLIIYRISDRKTIWSAGTANKGAIWAVIQGDGNFVVYDVIGTPLWNSGSGGHSFGAYQVVLTSNGKMQIYVEEQPIIWDSPQDNVPKACPGGQKMSLFPVCVRGNTISVPACDVSDAAQYARTIGGVYGPCH